MGIDSIKESQIKKHLEKLPTITLEALNKVWIEIILDRNDGNRSLSCLHLGISICKIRAWIIEKNIKAPKSVLGHPPKIKPLPKRDFK